ncbi:C2H2 type zinc finger domain protein [Moelleriella libera RCEF 2490]|uniref:C2H2 type zinc finger domain protein n=1 Tax=Moelleriella libera RCEF 2490 TaxID=1081109 RepID=A0A166UYN3_9HYPO|nr:C2H2 type zinc finger domain protein [Moelleriella libera RCEF 2490]
MKRSRELCGHADSNDGDDHKERPGEPDESSPAAKLSHRDLAEDDYQTEDNVKMKCWLPPHHAPLTFGSYREYESHYNLSHLNKCLECHKTFPSEHLLSIHIEELHDPLVRVRRDNGEHTYTCFVEDCDRKCLTPQKRRLHLIDKHMYPKNFFFDVTKKGISGRCSLLVDSTRHRRNSSTPSSMVQETRGQPGGGGTRGRGAGGLEDKSTVEAIPSPASEGGEDTEKSRVDREMMDLTGAMSALKFVPPSVRFGRVRAGFSKS